LVKLKGFDDVRMIKVSPYFEVLVGGTFFIEESYSFFAENFVIGLS